MEIEIKNSERDRKQKYKKNRSINFGGKNNINH